MAVITITGRIGSPVRPIGQEVARILDADYLDYQILTEISRRVGASVEALSHRDERALRGRERLGRLFQKILEKSAVGSAGDPFLGPIGIEVLISRSLAAAAQPAITPAQELDDAHYLQVMTSVVQDLARGGNAVMIGRGSHVILKELPRALHVYIVATLEFRTQFIMQLENLGSEAAARFIKNNEQSQIAYYRKFFYVEHQDPSLYHLFVNGEKLDTQSAARIIVAAAREREGVASPP